MTDLWRLRSRSAAAALALGAALVGLSLLRLGRAPGNRLYDCTAAGSAG